MKEKCCFLGCEQEATVERSIRYDNGTCSYHDKGGPFSSGETYEQYQIIEKDFIDFINVVPLAEEHYSVHSPFLRDIIIRACVQIEIFFKEWAKSNCTMDNTNPLLKKYNKTDKKSKELKGERNWTFKDYYCFKQDVEHGDSSIKVRVLDIDIFPFENWTEEKPPFWWESYNSIKHSGFDNKKHSTLKNALYSLAALFQLHLSNQASHSYLNSFNSPSITSLSLSLDKRNFNLTYHYIQTPLDSRKYLFRSNKPFYPNNNTKIPTEIGLSKRLESKKTRIN
ncbi:MAG: hypothetical protein V4667_09040 [Bacteroidota bacterium]